MAWKWANMAWCWRIKSAIGVDSVTIALQSKCNRTCGEPIIWANSTASAVLTRKSVSCGPSGSSAITMSVSSNTGTTARNTSAAYSMAWSRLTPGRRFRCWGEPQTITLPPKSAHNRAKSPKYWAVLRRTSGSGLVM